MTLLRALLTIAATAVWFVLLGPLIGGLPWNVFLFPIPLSYVLGAAPAAIAGALYATWMLIRQRRFEDESAFIRGAFCGALTTLGCCVAIFAVAKLGWPHPGFSPVAIVNSKQPTSFKAALVYAKFVPLLAVVWFSLSGAAAGGLCAVLLPKRIQLTQ
jgi:hypothetical protein